MEFEIEGENLENSPDMETWLSGLGEIKEPDPPDLEIEN